MMSLLGDATLATRVNLPVLWRMTGPNTKEWLIDISVYKEVGHANPRSKYEILQPSR